MKMEKLKKPVLVTRSSMPPMEEYINEISGIWESAWLTNMGVKHQELTKELEKRLGVDYVALFTNGHLALEMVLQAMHLEGEVITTPYTFASTTHAVVRNGLTPVFCDIRPDTYTIDPDKIEGLITDKTCAIVPVHVYGNICEIEKIQEIADHHHLKVIYDAAHAFYETYKGISTAAFGDASMFSFHATKVFNTIEGGAVATNQKEIFDKVNHLKNFGIENEETVSEVGGNAKMNEFQAAMGICNLRHLEEEIQKRKRAVMRYRERLQGIEGIQLCPVQEQVESNYAYFPVVFHEDILGVSRDLISEKLKEKNIFSRKYFYPLITDFGCYCEQYDSNQTPIAKKIASSVLTLPMFADLSVETVDYICDVIVGVINGSN